VDRQRRTVPFAFSLESVGDVTPTWTLVISLAYSALLVSVVGYLLWFHLLTTSGATAASAYHFMMPPLGMLFGWLLLGEHVAPADLVGIAPVALGIYLVTRPGGTATSQCGGSEVRIILAASPKCGLLNQSHTRSVSC
jgi:drug/metabolite transporter (DMT)-like permease